MTDAVKRTSILDAIRLVEIRAIHELSQTQLNVNVLASCCHLSVFRSLAVCQLSADASTSSPFRIQEPSDHHPYVAVSALFVGGAAAAAGGKQRNKY